MASGNENDGLTRGKKKKHHRHHEEEEERHNSDEKLGKRKIKNQRSSSDSCRSHESSSSYEREKARKRYTKFKASRSRSPVRSSSLTSQRRRYDGENRQVPSICHCLGVFGLSSYTQERDLERIFGQFGPVQDISIIYDRQSGRSKGYGFVYFKSTSDAIEARKACQGLELDGRPIRVDYSITSTPHPPTPGRYLGRYRPSNYERGYNRDRGDDYDDRCSYYRDSRDGYYETRSRYQSYDYGRDSYRGSCNDDYKRRPRRPSSYPDQC